MHPCDDTETLLRVLREPRRNNYFYGKRMDVQHFQMEQDYGKLKQWLVNRLTVGKGVLCGLRVSLDGGKVCVDPGVAIDGLGREIIVPVRSCIDPVTQEGGCCGDPCCSEHGATPQPPTDTQPPAGTPGGGTGAGDSTIPPTQPAPGRGTRPEVTTGLFTLWVCYRECRTDYQPVLVSDCGTREQCAAGTVVESFCLKITPGVPPLQGDPEWCARLWPRPADPGSPPPPAGDNTPGRDPRGPAGSGSVDLEDFLRATPGTGGTTVPVPTPEQARAALASRRHILCELFSGKCDPPEGDPCVPLAVLLLRDRRIVRFETCLVRPRVYSNAVLLDLILCLADKIEECCEHRDTPPGTATLLRVQSVEFLGGRNNQNVIATVQSPLTETPVPIDERGNAIRIKFTQPFDQGANTPSTPGLNDATWKRHNVLVLPEGANPPAGLPYVPGTLTIEAPDTIRWTLSRESPFWSRQHNGWQKGLLRLSIFGDADAATARLAVTDTGGKALDGEPITPAGGAMSGNGTPGGTFTSLFRVG